MAQILAGSMLVFQDGTKVPAEEHLKDKIVALYFSAGWCGPCQQFTPVLKAIFPFHFSFQDDMNIQKFYDDLKEEGINNFEIVFLSWDESAEEQEQYFRDAHGRWARLDYSDPKNKELCDKFIDKGIPALKLIRPCGKEVVADCTRYLQTVVSGRYCDICKDLVGDLWYKCQDCEDYDLCKKCKTHLMINPEHTFKETKADVKPIVPKEVWAVWMAEYNKPEDDELVEKGNLVE